jgi:hypothetical protein
MGCWFWESVLAAHLHISSLLKFTCLYFSLQLSPYGWLSLFNTTMMCFFFHHFHCLALSCWYMCDCSCSLPLRASTFRDQGVSLAVADVLAQFHLTAGSWAEEMTEKAMINYHEGVGFFWVHLVWMNERINVDVASVVGSFSSVHYFGGFWHRINLKFCHWAG